MGLTKLTPVIENGTVKYIVGSSVDITRLKQTEFKLQQTLKYERLISNLAALALKEEDIEVFLTKSMEVLGEGMEANRVYLTRGPHFFRKQILRLYRLGRLLFSQGVGGQRVNLMWTAVWILSRSLLLLKTTKRLQQENEKFNALVNSTDDVIFLLDTGQRHVAVYGRWLERYEIPVEFFWVKPFGKSLGKKKLLSMRWPTKRRWMAKA